MGKKNNRICIICNKPYHYCPTCGEDAGKPTWHFVFDNENCNEIYETCVAYRDKVISIKEASEKINKLDLSELENFAESTKAQIKEILQYKENNTIQKSTVSPKVTYTKNNK